VVSKSGGLYPRGEKDPTACRNRAGSSASILIGLGVRLLLASARGLVPLHVVALLGAAQHTHELR
jgi:hypothetical protein